MHIQHPPCISHPRPSPPAAPPVMFADVTSDLPDDPPAPPPDIGWSAFSLSSRQDQLRLPLLMQHPVEHMPTS